MPGYGEIEAGEIGRARRGTGAASLASVLLVLGLTHGPVARAVSVAHAARPARIAAPLPHSAGLIRLMAGGAVAFFPARHRALDRIAAAVAGAESNYGTNPAMWRTDPLGPQGPMQVSAAAAADVGGGNRFDVNGNLALGRAYLARMYHHYGSWADAVAAYNWGPSHMDAWIDGGRRADRLPAVVERYTGEVLLSSFAPGARLAVSHMLAPGFVPHRPGIRAQPFRLRRIRSINPRDPVQQLYQRVMQASVSVMR